jgi:uncharacterized protein (UPF0332 family)
MLAARVGLQIGDSDTALNRSYYAMFDMARAALLNAGVPEDKLPRTHSGVIGAFRQHAIESGKIDVGLASALSRAEGLRLLADYTDTEVDIKSAANAVAQAETFVQTVERVFDLEVSYQETGLEKGSPNLDDKVSEPAVANQRTKDNQIERPPFSLEDERRLARENWLRFKQQKIGGARNVGHEQETDRDAKDDQSHSLDDNMGG